MKKVYICSPYRAKDGAELVRHIEYTQELTKQAIEAGLAPITPHLYMTQCLNEDKPQERAAGMAAGLELLKACELVLVGVKYGIDKAVEEIERRRKAAGREVEYKAFELYFMQGKEYAEIAEELETGKNTPRRWVTAIINELSVLLWGIDEERAK